MHGSFQNPRDNLDHVYICDDRVMIACLIRDFNNVR